MKALALLLLSFLLNFSATAANLVILGNYQNDDYNYSLYNFDTDTGLTTLRTSISGYHRFIAMDQRPSDGTVFAVNAGDLDPSGLYTININTGAYSLIGLTGVSGFINGVAFNPLNGQLFGLRYAGGRLGELWSINQQTGAATFIGSTGSVDQGLVCSPSGQLFGFDRWGSLYRIDPATAATTPVGGSVILDIVDPAFDPSGTLYAYNHSGGGIYTIDTVTGNGTLIAPTPFQFNPLGLIVAPVPEPGAAALGIIGVTMLFLFRRNTRSRCQS
jgi:outer membrane protein assembly factor BamB